MNKYTVIDNGSDYDYDYRVTVVDGKKIMRELNQMLFTDINSCGNGVKETWLDPVDDVFNNLTRVYYSSGRDVYQVALDENGDAVELMYTIKGTENKLISRIMFVEKEHYERKHMVFDKYRKHLRGYYGLRCESLDK